VLIEPRVQTIGVQAEEARQMTINPSTATMTEVAVRPFRVDVPEEQLADLRRRIAATRWPDRETVTDQSQGVQLARLQALALYWSTGYDWRKVEAKLNALPQFVTEIDGLPIHFIHVRSRQPNALPVVITHGWPGSVLELIKTIGPLTDPGAFGGRAEDAFDVVMPSLPGYGFSAHPIESGWGPERIGSAWDALMRRLGYTRYVAQGGDYGAVVTHAIGRQAPAGLLGIHVNLPATVPLEVLPAIGGGPAQAGLSAKERAALDQVITAAMRDTAYSLMMGTKPQTIGYSLNDSPVGLAAWMLGHPGFNRWAYGGDPEQPTKDEVLDDITLYWLTSSPTSAARSYWENHGRSPLVAAAQMTADISIPTAVTAFPGEIYVAPESWARRAYPKLIYFHEADKGGHFAALEQPEIFSRELRAAFTSLR
jgi:pimeloyl-ACP methyl ester carboxylesterase